MKIILFNVTWDEVSELRHLASLCTGPLWFWDEGKWIEGNRKLFGDEVIDELLSLVKHNNYNSTYIVQLECWNEPKWDTRIRYPVHWP